MLERIEGRKSAVIAGLGLLLRLASLPAVAIDWSSVKENKIHFFYPGETSLEWMNSKRDHDGAAKYKKRKNSCQDCHAGDEQTIGNLLVVGSKSESKPLVGRRGYVPATLQAAFTDTDIHIRIKWQRTGEQVTWPKFTDLEEIRSEHYNSRLTLILDDKSIEEFDWGGCWALCHADEKGMTMDGGKGSKEKYLAESRVEMHRKTGGGDNLRSDAEIQELINKGVFLEYWQAGLNPGLSVDGLDGTILKERVENQTQGVSVTAVENGDEWVVDFKRPLQAAPNHKPFKPGKQYTIGLALHDQSTAGRYHLVTLELTMALGSGDSMIIAVKQ